MRLWRLLLPVWLLLLTLLASTTACGPVIHCAVAHRATRRLAATQHEYEPSLLPPAYYQLLDVQYLDYTLAGSIFPDYLYHCGGQHAASEVVHWSYYQRAAIQYIHSHYGAEVLKSIHSDSYHPQSEQLKQLLAFLVGVVTHSISDISWHGLSTMVDGLPAEYGLIQLIGALDFGCDGTLCEEAHDKADYGTDFIIALQRQMQLWLKPHTLKLPIDDILGIYQLLDYTSITAATLRQCHVEFQAMMLGVQRFAPYMYHTATDASPTLQEEWLHSFVGGVDDMTIQSMQGVKRFLWWLEHGVPDELPDKWRPDDGVEVAAAMQPYHQRKAVLYAKLQRLSQPITQSAVWQQYVSGKVAYDAVDAWLTNSDALQLLRADESALAGDEHPFIVEPNRHLTDHHERAKQLPSYTNVKHKLLPTDEPAVHHLVSTRNDAELAFDYSSSSYFAFALTTVNHNPDGRTDQDLTQSLIVVSSPGSGSLFNGRIWPDHLQIKDAAAGAQAGYALVAVGMDCDGILDLVYSQPLGGRERYNESSFVDVVYHIDGSVIVHDMATLRDRLVVPFDTSETAAASPYGEVLSVLPKASYYGTDWLVIGSPHAGGQVELLDQQFGYAVEAGVVDTADVCTNSTTPDAITPEARQWSFLNFSLFGTASAGGAALKYPNTLRTVGLDTAPAFRGYGCNGLVFIMTWRPLVGPFAICGDAEDNAKFGQAVAYSPELDLLAISAINANASDGARSSGKVYLLHNITDFIAEWPRSQRVPMFTPSNYTGNITTISHPSAGARFGFKLLFAQLRNNSDSAWSLVIAAPMYSRSLNHTHGGSVLIYDNPHLLPVNTTVDAVDTATFNFIGTESNAQLGRSMTISANDTSLDDSRTPTLFIGAPYTTLVREHDKVVLDNCGIMYSCRVEQALTSDAEELVCGDLPPIMLSQWHKSIEDQQPVAQLTAVS